MGLSTLKNFWENQKKTWKVGIEHTKTWLILDGPLQQKKCCFWDENR
jgi:hypothetical protein